MNTFNSIQSLLVKTAVVQLIINGLFTNSFTVNTRTDITNGTTFCTNWIVNYNNTSNINNILTVGNGNTFMTYYGNNVYNTVYQNYVSFKNYLNMSIITISQSVTVSQIGMYKFSLYYLLRPGYMTNYKIEALIDDVLIHTVTINTSITEPTWTLYTIDTNITSTGSKILKIKTTPLASIDNQISVTNVTLIKI